MSKLSKQLLSWLLLAAMLCTLLPTAVFADDAAEELVVEPTEDAVVLDDLEPQPQDADSEETVTEETVIEDQLPEDTEEPEPVSFGDELEADYVEATAAPTITDTTENPFSTGTGGSNSFRIPALVTLSDGTLVAAADARWNTTYDGGGLDTMVAWSEDNGATWGHTFANYLGDNGNQYNGSGSTAFIDPALVVTNDDTIYMLCDLYPYGVALNGSGATTPVKNVGFNDKGYLRLDKDNNGAYAYYLKDGKIYLKDGTVVTGYTVDDYFNITSSNGVTSNLFFSDSPFKVVRTGYLYLTSSKDGGKSWSAPTLLSGIKTSSELVCLVGPGRGLYTSDDKIVFPVYSYNGNTSSQCMGFIYSEDGTSWTRVDSSVSWSSESAVVELANGSLRFFYRNGTSKLCYVDYSWSEGWGSTVNTEVATNSNCQISAITYSQKTNGQQVILVSCPAGPDGGSNQSGASYRLNGKIFTFTVNSDGTMNQINSVAVDSQHGSKNYFMYSCLTELQDGGAAILYEDNESAWGTGDNSYYQMSYKTYAAHDLSVPESAGDGIEADGTPDADDTTTKNVTVTMTVGDSPKVYTEEDKNDSGNVNCSELDTAIATVTVTGQDAGTIDTYTQASPYCADAISQNSNNWTKTSYYYKVDDNYYPVYAKRSSSYNSYNYTWGYSPNDSSSKVSTIGNQNSVQNPTTTKVSIEVYSKSITTNKASTTVTISPVAAGTTYVTVGDTKYTIVVNKLVGIENRPVAVDNSITLNPAVPVGCTVTYSVTSGANYITLNNGVVKGVAEGTATVKATVKKGGKDYAEYTYTITVSDGTPVEIKENETKTLEMNTTLTSGQYIKWTTADSQYVGVAGVYDSANSTYKNEGVIVGQEVTTAPVVVTGTIYNEDGTAAESKKWLVTVTEGDADTNSTQKHIYVDVKTIENCKVYYSVNAGPLVEVTGTGVLVDKDVTGHYNIMFFAAPNEGYALTYMGVSGSGNQYYTLSNGNPDGTGSDAWPLDSAGVYKSGHGFQWSLREGNYTQEQMKIMFSNAIALGCDGATNFTKNGTASFYTQVRFVAQKLPTLEKEIVSVTHNGSTTSYTKGMTIERGDTINYKVTVKEYAKLTGSQWDGRKSGDGSNSTYNPATGITGVVDTDGSYGEITYSQVATGSAQLTDELTDSAFYTDEAMSKKANVANFLGSSVAEDTDHVYYTKLELTDKNFATVVKEGKITNTANLTYNYKSEYSNGDLSSKADAEAIISVKLPEYVVDFGMSVELSMPEYFGNQTNSNYKITEATATYGDCAINADRNTITYTPKRVLLGTDYVRLTVQNSQTGDKVAAMVEVHPANNVMYEDGFVTAGDGWTRIGTASKSTQQAPNKDSDIYGHDTAYTNTSNTYSNGTALKATVNGANTSIASFTFTGDGLELMGECGQNTGVMYVRVSNGAPYTTSDGTTAYTNKVYIVDTYYNGTLTNGSGTVNVDTLKQVPLVHDLELPYGEHTVSILGYNIKGGASQNAAVAAMSLEPGQGLSFAANRSLDIDAILAEMGDEDAVVEYISMNEVLGGSDEGVAVYADQVYDAAATASSGYDVVIDGFRVYNTLKTEPAAYAEQGAKFVSLYEKVNDSTWNEAEGSGSGIVYVENVNGASTAYGEYKNSGPENEIYLAKDHGIAFKVGATGTYTVQVSAKAINGIPKLNTTSSNGTTIDTKTELYYKITPDQDDTFVIYNNGDDNSILSLVDLKVIGGTWENQTITTQELDNAVYLIQNPQDPEDPEEPSEPEEPSNPGDSDDDNDEEAWQNPFQDVIFGKFYYEAIRWLHSHGIIKGMTESEFGLKEPADRAMVVAMLYRLEGKPEVTGTSSFSDVRKGSYYEKAVIWAEQNYLVTGNPDGTFRPKQKISREELITILYRYNEFKGKDPAGSADLGKFSDNSEIHKYAKNAMRWAVDNGIVKGYNEYGQYLVKPRSETIRSEMATLLYRVYNLINGN